MSITTYVDDEILKYVEQIQDIPNKIKNFKKITSVDIKLPFANLNMDIARLNDDKSSIKNRKETEQSLDEMLSPIEVVDYLDAINRGEISSGKLVRINASRIIVERRYNDQTIQINGSFLKYTPESPTVQIRNEEYLQANLIDVSDGGNNYSIIKILFRNVNYIQKFFDNNEHIQYVEIFGITEQVNKDPVKIENDEIIAETSIGVIVALLRTGITPKVAPDIIPPPPQKPLIISIMGSAGGVGKSTIVRGIAENIAESKTNLLIIDFDITTNGLTERILENVNKSIGNTKTVYDHLLPYSKLNVKISSDDNLIDITSKYLVEENLGRIYLLPARPQHPLENPYDIIADIDKNERMTILLKEIDSMFSRTKTVDENIGCIIIDCGADSFNPLYSAAVYKSNCSFMVVAPRAGAVDNVKSTIDGHIKRCPEIDDRKVKVILNMVPTYKDGKELKAQLKPLMTVGVISDDPEIRRRVVEGPNYYDLGFGDFENEINKKILPKSIGENYQYVIPKEEDVRLKWYRQLIKRQIPERTLKSTSFRFKSILSIVLLLGGISLTAYLFYLLNTISRSSPSIQTNVTLISVEVVSMPNTNFIIIIALGAVFSLGIGLKLFLNQRKTKHLLEEVKRKGYNREFIQYLQENYKKQIEWLYLLLKKDREITRKRKYNF